MSDTAWALAQFDRRSFYEKCLDFPRQRCGALLDNNDSQIDCDHRSDQRIATSTLTDRCPQSALIDDD